MRSMAGGALTRSAVWPPRLRCLRYFAHPRKIQLTQLRQARLCAATLCSSGLASPWSKRSGVPPRETYLGYMYQYGLGVPRDYVLAASWLHQAAERGEPTGQFLLGLLFDKGYSVPLDGMEAEVWFNLAAAHARPRN